MVSPSDIPLPAYPLGRQTVGRYEILYPLARGGMAWVFLGRLSGIAGFEKLVAIKVIHPELASQRDFVEMFLDEARLSAQIHHPNVTEIFEVGEDNGLYFMVAELVQGQSLTALSKKMALSGQQLDSRVYLSIIAKVCDALHVAHTLRSSDGSPMGLVHRDITPKNILISYDGYVKLIDFGVAFAKGRLTNTRTGVVKGTIGYMSPEQLEGKPVDRRIDIFALGVLLFKLATGKHPFPGATDEEQMYRLLNVPHAAIRSLVPDADPALEATVHKALAIDPKRRHSTAEMLGQEVRDLLVPQGGPVDNVYLAELMTRVFSKEISKQKKALQRALAMSVPPTSGFVSQEHEIGDKARSSHPGDFTLQGWQKNSSKHKRKGWRRNAIAVLAATAVLLAFLFARNYGVDKKIVQELTSRDSATAGKEEYQPPLNETIRPSAEENEKAEATPPKSVPSEGNHPHSQDTANDVEPQKTVYLLLKGLPDSASVLLNGNEAPLVGGKIAVPADGAKRELNVIADGYLPHSQFVAPGEDGELTVQLEKKRDAPPEAIHTKRPKGKNKGKKLLENPYGKQ